MASHPQHGGNPAYDAGYDDGYGHPPAASNNKATVTITTTRPTTTNRARPTLVSRMVTTTNKATTRANNSRMVTNKTATTKPAPRMVATKTSTMTTSTTTRAHSKVANRPRQAPVATARGRAAAVPVVAILRRTRKPSATSP